MDAEPTALIEMLQAHLEGQNPQHVSGGVRNADLRAALSRMAWREQPWMGQAQRKGRWDTHDEAMDGILSAATVTVLSYEEAALIYARARGFIVDDADLMGQRPRLSKCGIPGAECTYGACTCRP